jgi:hypothetical protein
MVVQTRFGAVLANFSWACPSASLILPLAVPIAREWETFSDMAQQQLLAFDIDA